MKSNECTDVDNTLEVEHTYRAAPITWDEYWGRFGEQLVWNGWIEKYGDFVETSPYAPPALTEEIVCDSVANTEQNGKHECLNHYFPTNTSNALDRIPPPLFVHNLRRS